MPKMKNTVSKIKKLFFRLEMKTCEKLMTGGVIYPSW